MTASAIASELANMTYATATEKAKTTKVTGTESAQLSQNEFLELMLLQYQYQDPMEPMDNSEMVSQQCQFSQLSATQEMQSNMASSNSMTQASSLVGKSVVLQDPNDAENVLYGTVSAAYLDGSDSGVVVGENIYPLKYVKYAYDGTTTSAGESGNVEKPAETDTTKTDNTTDNTDNNKKTTGLSYKWQY